MTAVRQPSFVSMLTCHSLLTVKIGQTPPPAPSEQTTPNNVPENTCPATGQTPPFDVGLTGDSVRQAPVLGASARWSTFPGGAGGCPDTAH